MWSPALQLDEEFDEVTPDGRQTRALLRMEGGKVVCTQTAKKAGEKSTKVRAAARILLYCIPEYRDFSPAKIGQFIWSI